MVSDLANWFGSTAALPAALRGGVVAVGNFDGVHLAHRAVLAAASDLAREAAIPALALTFEPHPRTFFRPQEPVFRLTGPRRKAELLLAAGMDGVVSEVFDAGLAGMTAEDFIRVHLVAHCGARHVVTGYDFHFGRNRSGSPELLRQAGGAAGFDVTLVEQFTDPDEPGRIVSSSRIREALAGGDVAEANRLLARPFDVAGTVVAGARLGRTLGYPTANLRLPDEARLRHGIYAVRMRRADGSLHDGVASFGRRPTFDNGAPLLETFVFDFAGDLYGEAITIIFHGWIRPEEKFDSVEALVGQMDRDSAEARRILAASAA
ncbi:MAG: bifunctional riboflavin kinase/FAD synthetase [Nitratireductor sp.]|nr:bifunctional riboflavin kinase/FAD synthetase [Nitratireductor sp.]